MSPFWSDSIPCAPHAGVLTALRHRGRIFAVHAAENARFIMGLCPTPQYYIRPGAKWRLMSPFWSDFIRGVLYPTPLTAPFLASRNENDRTLCPLIMRSYFNNISAPCVCGFIRKRTAHHYLKTRGVGMTSPPGCRGGAPALTAENARRQESAFFTLTVKPSFSTPTSMVSPPSTSSAIIVLATKVSILLCK